MARNARPLEWLGYQTQQTSADLAAMSVTEIEALAGATAAALIKAAHTRESEAETKAQTLLSEAMTHADRVRTEAEKMATTTTQAAQKSASTLIRSANETAETSLKNAERQSAEIVADANRQAEDIIARATTEASRIKNELERNMASNIAQMQGAISKFSSGVQSQLQMARQIGLKASQIETELMTARDAITEIGSSLFETPEQKPDKRR